MAGIYSKWPGAIIAALVPVANNVLGFNLDTAELTLIVLPFIVKT